MFIAVLFEIKDAYKEFTICEYVCCLNHYICAGFPFYFVLLFFFVSTTEDSLITIVMCPL